MNLEQWPSLGDTKTSPSRELDDWEYVSEINDDVEETKSNHVAYGNITKLVDSSNNITDSPIIHRCESTPEFSSYSTLGSAMVSDDEFSFLNDCNSSIAAESLSTSKDDTILLSHKPKKVPSFKDMILFNAEKLKEEELKKKEQMQQLAKEKRKDAMLRKKQSKTRLVVTPIKRCARSTGDLRSLIIHEGEEGYSGMNSPVATIIYEEDEVLGYTDAQEYYDRKSHGNNGRSKGQRIRPDEARRKEMIIHKKNAQRRAQGIKAKKK